MYSVVKARRSVLSRVVSESETRSRRRRRRRRRWRAAGRGSAARDAPSGQLASLITSPVMSPITSPVMAAPDGGGGLGLQAWRCTKVWRASSPVHRGCPMCSGASSVMWEAAAQHFQVVGAL
eukprot:scaffold12203_cov65-Phaeocystis_antarctica.AAC.1